MSGTPQEPPFPKQNSQCPAARRQLSRSATTGWTVSRAPAGSRARTIITGGDMNFGKQMPMKRAGQPAELATAFVMLADPMSSYVSGATIAVTSGKPIL